MIIIGYININILGGFLSCILLNPLRRNINLLYRITSKTILVSSRERKLKKDY